MIKLKTMICAAFAAPLALAAGAVGFSPRMVHSAYGLDKYPDDYLEPKEAK